jgi:hypothetical protein
LSLNKSNQLDSLREKLLKQQEESISESDSEIKTSVDLNNNPNEAVDETKFELIYNEYIALLDRTAKSRISSFLKNSRFKVLNESIVELEIRSKLEMELLEEEKLDMIPFFRRGLKNASFDFSLVINTDLITQTKKLSKQDLLKIMAEKNPLVSDLVQGLGLELEY